MSAQWMPRNHGAPIRWFLVRGEPGFGAVREYAVNKRGHVRYFKTLAAAWRAADKLNHSKEGLRP